MEHISAQLLQQHVDELAASFAADYTLMINKKSVHLEHLQKQLPEMVKIQFDFSISHGKYGASFGKFETEKETYQFAINVHFTNTTKKELTAVYLLIVS